MCARYGLTISPTFDPVRRDTVSAQVRQRLTDAIHAGDLAPGSPLPPERVLCQEFGVARTSVREAIQGLVIAGFVERRGNRSVVVERTTGLELDDDDPATRVVHLLELRRAIEPALAALAAERATPAQRRLIAAVVDPPPASLDEVRRADPALAEACANASASPLLADVHAQAMAFGRTTGALAAMWSAADDSSDPGRALTTLARAVAKGDADGARHAAVDLLGLVELLAV
jgi:GntR family transcriptional regulator, transcriptional repressor for pyruvate dehydrogenase complex